MSIYGLGAKVIRSCFLSPYRLASHILRGSFGTSLVQLTGAASPGCGMLMMHQSKTENGVDSMASVKSVTVPAHGSVSFAPGGYHLMCMSPQATMVIGKSVPVTLTFADGKTVAADFPVTGPGGREMSSGDHKMMMGDHDMHMPSGGH